MKYVWVVVLVGFVVAMLLTGGFRIPQDGLQTAHGMDGKPLRAQKP